MPTLQMTVPQGDLSEAEKAEVVERLTTTLSDFFQERKDENVRDFVMVHIGETAKGGYALGGTLIG